MAENLTFYSIIDFIGYCRLQYPLEALLTFGFFSKIDFIVFVLSASLTQLELDANERVRLCCLSSTCISRSKKHLARLCVKAFTSFLMRTVPYDS